MILEKVPDGSAAIVRKRKGKLLLSWARPPLHQQVVDVAAHAQELIGERLRRALRRWHKKRGAHG